MRGGGWDESGQDCGRGRERIGQDKGELCVIN